MRKKKLVKKFITMGLALSMTVSSISMTAFAAETDTEYEEVQIIDSSADVTEETDYTDAYDLDETMNSNSYQEEETTDLQEPSDQVLTEDTEEDEAEVSIESQEEKSTALIGSRGDNLTYYIATIDGKEYNSYCLELGKPNPREEDVNTQEKIYFNLTDNFFDNEGLVNIFPENDDRYKGLTSEERAAESKRILLRLENALTEAKKAKWKNAAKELVMQDTGLTEEELDELLPYMSEDFLDQFYNHAINDVVWAIMYEEGLGKQTKDDSDPITPALLKDGFEKALYQASLSEEENIISKPDEVIINSASGDKLIFDKKEDGSYVSQEFTLMINPDDDPNFNYTLPEGFSLVEENGSFKIISSSKPNKESLKLVMDFFTKVNAGVYISNGSDYNKVTGKRNYFQNMLVADPQVDKLEYTPELDIVADLTIKKVDEETGEEIQNNTAFYLWFIDNETTYYIVKSTAEDGSSIFIPVEFSAEKDKSNYTITVAGSQKIDNVLLEGIVYYLQEAAAPEGYDLDPTIQIICSDAQYQELTKSLGDSDFKITNVAEGKEFEAVRANVTLDADADDTTLSVSNKLHQEDPEEEDPEEEDPDEENSDEESPDQDDEYLNDDDTTDNDTEENEDSSEDNEEYTDDQNDQNGHNTTVDNQSSGEKTSESAKTGDNNQLGLWALLVLFASVICGSNIILRIRKRNFN